MNRGAEQMIHKNIAHYLHAAYPRIIFNTDLSGVKLSKTQAGLAKHMRSRDKFPDMVIYSANCGAKALFLEIKGTRKQDCIVKARTAEWKTPHVTEQAATMKRLRDAGYMCSFAIGFAHAKIIIDAYLNRNYAGLKNMILDSPESATRFYKEFTQ